MPLSQFLSTPLGQFYFSLEGRITRPDYWLRFQLPFLAAYLAASFIDPNILAPIVSIALLWPAIAVSVKRLHDRNRAGWMLLLVLVPLVGVIWFFIDAGCLDGVEGQNQYGQDPKGRKAKG